MNWLGGLLNEFEGKPLQKTGMLSREQVLAFFDKSSSSFANPEFKSLLRVGYERGQNVQDLVNEMQFQIFQAMGVQGDFGIGCLSKIRMVYSQDAELLKMFYTFVNSEEMLLDEVELPSDAYKAKYDEVAKFKAALEEKVKDMTPEQAQQYASQMMAAMVISGPGGAAPCCVNGTCSLHGAPGGTTTVAPTEEGGPAAPAMTEQEQLAFFESLTRKS